MIGPTLTPLDLNVVESTNLTADDTTVTADDTTITTDET